MSKHMSQLNRPSGLGMGTTIKLHTYCKGFESGLYTAELTDSNEPSLDRTSAGIEVLRIVLATCKTSQTT